MLIEAAAASKPPETSHLRNLKNSTQVVAGSSNLRVDSSVDTISKKPIVQKIDIIASEITGVAGGAKSQRQPLKEKSRQQKNVSGNVKV